MYIKTFLLVSFSFLCLSFSQAQDFNLLIRQTADTLASKIVSTGKKKIAITDFINIDESTTRLGTFLSNEISSELSNLTANQTRFRVLERSNLDQVFKEKHLINFSDPSGLAKELGKIDAADVLVFALITDFDGYYRVVIKMLDTKNGDALSSYKVNFVKTPSLENLDKIITKKSQHPASALNNNPVSPSTNESVSNTGDICFKNIWTPVAHEAKISVFKNGDDSRSKSINVTVGQTGCIYGLEPGIYQVIVNWVGRWDNKSESKEIRVTAGKTGNMEVKLGW